MILDGTHTFCSLVTAFQEGLTPELQWELACHNKGFSFGQLITLTIKLDNLLRTRQTHNPSLTNVMTVSPFLPGPSGSNHKPM